MTQRIMIVGAYGKMGTVATATLRKSNNFEIIPVGRQDDLSSQLKTHKPSAVLELTDKSSVYENCQKILSAACPLVIGASGLRDPERKHLDEIAIEHETPCLLVPNFSIAAVLMDQAAKYIAPYMPKCEIIEHHHTQKKDAPSATSLHTADIVMRAVSSSPSQQQSTSDRASQGTVPIHSIRTAGVVAQQHVIFGQEGETLTISLSQTSRTAFAPGIEMAMTQINELEPGLHVGMQCLLGIQSMMA